MLIKAQPVIDAIKSIELQKKHTKILLLSPSETIYNQSLAHRLVDDYTDIVLICGRYEGVDERVKDWCKREFDTNFTVVSLGQYVTL
jgi:tRNA (guanine37-N1)-methyltransferase